MGIIKIKSCSGMDQICSKRSYHYHSLIMMIKRFLAYFFIFFSEPISYLWPNKGCSQKMLSNHMVPWEARHGVLIDIYQNTNICSVVKICQLSQSIVNDWQSCKNGLYLTNWFSSCMLFQIDRNSWGLIIWWEAEQLDLVMKNGPPTLIFYRQHLKPILENFHSWPIFLWREGSTKASWSSQTTWKVPKKV